MMIRTIVAGRPHWWVSRRFAFHVLGLDGAGVLRPAYIGALRLRRGSVHFDLDHR